MVQKSTDFKNIAIVHIKKCIYRIYFLGMSKHEEGNFMNDNNLKIL